jgi:hypothetical protein
MDTKSARGSTGTTPTNGNAPKRRRTSAKAKSKSTSKKAAKALEKRALSRKEKLDSVRKANQALLKALELLSQHNGNVTDA